LISTQITIHITLYRYDGLNRWSTTSRDPVQPITIGSADQLRSADSTQPWLLRWRNDRCAVSRRRSSRHASL